MSAMYYIGLDIHKKTIAYCIKRIDGQLVRQGTVAADRTALKNGSQSCPAPGWEQWRPQSLPVGSMTF